MKKYAIIPFHKNNDIMDLLSSGNIQANTIYSIRYLVLRDYYGYKYNTEGSLFTAIR